MGPSRYRPFLCAFWRWNFSPASISHETRNQSHAHARLLSISSLIRPLFRTCGFQPREHQGSRVSFRPPFNYTGDHSGVHAPCGSLREKLMSCSLRKHWHSIIGPIPWGHSGPLCHALSLSSSSLSSLWTSHAACAIAIAGVRLATPGDWQCNGGSHLANGPNIFKCFLFIYSYKSL